MATIKTYLEYLTPVIQSNWDKPALVDASPSNMALCHSYTYGQMYQQMRRIGSYLRLLGVDKGDHVALCGSNSSHWMLGYLSVASIRAVNVSLLHTLSADTIAQQLAFSDAKVLLAEQSVWEELKAQELPQGLIVVSLDTWSVLQGKDAPSLSVLDEPLNPKDDATIAFPDVDENDPAQLCFTSGTSEMAKGVLASWKNITCNVLCTSENYAPTDNLVTVSVFPLGHTLAIVGEFLVPLKQGCTIHILRDTAVPDNMLDLYLKCKPFEIVLVPMVVERLVSERYVERFKQVIEFLEVGVVCGAKLKKELEDRLMELHYPLTVPYGMTECSPIVCIDPPSGHKAYASGKACRFMQLSFGENDEILVKGDQVMLGYYKDEKATRIKIDADGWMHTGDSGYLDEEGNLFVHGRIKTDMLVLSSGENVSPSAIESKLDAIDGVVESVVVLRNDKIIAWVYTGAQSMDKNTLLATINPSLPMHSQIYDIEFLSEPLKRTEKQTIARYLYK